ncbi:MAG: HyaD/HybD family hydrogenase maturation endopeptidase [Sedimentisphaerales bacterium]
MHVKTDNPAVKPVNSGAKEKSVLILGLGNILLKDEGVGVHAAKQLQGLALPDNVEVIDGGTAAADMLLSQEGLDKLVVIDAIRAGEKPGTTYKARFKASEIDKLTRIFGGDKDLKISPHQFGLIDALAAAEKMNRTPKEIVIIGIEPKEINYGLELTEQVSQRIPEVVNMVLEEI